MICGKNNTKGKYSIKILNSSKHDVPKHTKCISWSIIEWRGKGSVFNGMGREFLGKSHVGQTFEDKAGAKS